MFEKEFLTRCSVYSLKSERPIFREVLEEGDTTFYGIILMANKDPQLREYLLSKKKFGDLWEYQDDYGYSPIDAPWVVEGLMNFGLEKDKAQIARSLDVMFKSGFEEKSGTIIALYAGKSAYWFGPDLDATSHLSYLLGRFDFNKFKSVLERTTDFIKKSQLPSGLWDSKWYGSNLLSSFLALRTLFLFPQKYKPEIKKSMDSIIGMQNENGSFKDSILETSIAILIFEEIKCCEKNKIAARKWLSKDREIPMTPFLYYWFEEKDEKKFFDCWDKGKLTESFRKLALKRVN
ncbi:MAG: hypothetical protein ACHQYQ_09955 [Bacteriovoracales bacterium]